MRRKPHPEDDGMRVWMNGGELDQLINKMEERRGTPGAIAGRLGGHCGLRRGEAAGTTQNHIADTLGGEVLRVPERNAKNDKYRETPVPTDLADRVRMVSEYDDDIGPDDAVLDVVAKTLNRWTKNAAKELAAETGDDGWLDVTYHDLRRTWGTRCLEQGMLPSVVMAHGGWNDWETFREHYLGEFSPEALRRERSKVSWLTDSTRDHDNNGHAVTVSPAPAQHDH